MNSLSYFENREYCCSQAYSYHKFSYAKSRCIHLKYGSYSGHEHCGNSQKGRYGKCSPQIEILTFQHLTRKQRFSSGSHVHGTEKLCKVDGYKCHADCHTAHRAAKETVHVSVGHPVAYKI